ncbi:hypothetical protein F1880_000193 [Penicillium rolfsii]|nr:hypothetical protein F1880_000193 [Penicillium rolfsii]
MAHHGHRHDRISRLIRAKHRLEASEEVPVDSNLLSGLEIQQDPLFPSDHLSSDKDCDALQNTTCLDDAPDATVVVLSKRQDAQTPTTTVVETVVQVVDTNSQTLWQSSGVDFPMTITDSAFGTLVLTSSSALSTNTFIPSSVGNATATQSTSSKATETLAPTSSQLAAISSPRASSAIGSVSYTSTRLIPSSSATNTSSPTSTSVHAAGNYYSSISSSSASTFSSTDATTSSYTPVSTSGSSTDSGNGSGSGSGSGSTSVATTSQSKSSSGSGSGIDPTTSKIVGGVVGSVAGLAMIFLVLFYLFRRRKLLLQQKGTGTVPLPSDDGGTTREMTTRSSNEPLFSASYLAPAFMKRWRQSTMTVRSESTVSSNPSERGFQKISGRKIPPVLTHGGDGYGGRLDGDSPTLPGFPPMSPAGGATTSPSSLAPPPTSPYGMVLDTKYTQEAEERAESPVRPPLVHLPTSSSVNVGVVTTVTPSTPIAEPQSAIAVIPQGPDGLGRSLASYDGSRSSRFTESIDR